MKKAILVLTLGLNPGITQAKNEVCKDSACEARVQLSTQKAQQKTPKLLEHEELMQKINVLIEKAYYLGFALGNVSGIFGFILLFSGLKWALERRHP